MNDDLEVQPSGGGAGKPSPAPSQKLSLSDLDPAELETLLRPTVERLTKAQLDSNKDKGIARLNTKVADLERSFEDRFAFVQGLMAKGMSQDEALWRLKVNDALLANPPEETPKATPNAGDGTPSKAAPSAVSTQILLQSLALDANDPEVLDLVRNGKGWEDFVLLKNKRMSQPAQTTPASPLPTGGGSTVQGETIESLTEEREELSKDYRKNHQRINEINDKINARLRQG